MDPVQKLRIEILFRLIWLKTLASGLYGLHLLALPLFWLGPENQMAAAERLIEPLTHQRERLERDLERLLKL